MNAHLAFLLSDVFSGALHPAALADLRRSGLTDETIRLHKIRSVPPDLIGPLLGGDKAARSVRHAVIIPFPDPAGGWLDYVKLKVFSSDEPGDVPGARIEESGERFLRYNGGARKYLVRRHAAPHLYIPIPTMREALAGSGILWICEGMKKALSLSQLGLPAVAIESAWSWHLKGSTEILPDFDAVQLAARTVKIVPDPDAETNPSIAKAVRMFGTALRGRGARVLYVKVPPVEVVA